MSDIHIEKQHNFDLETAREKAQQWLNEAKSAYGLDVDYHQGSEQDTVQINRSGVDGRAVLDADKLVFDAKLGWLAKALKGKIEQELRAGLDKYFA